MRDNWRCQQLDHLKWVDFNNQKSTPYSKASRNTSSIGISSKCRQSLLSKYLQHVIKQSQYHFESNSLNLIRPSLQKRYYFLTTTSRLPTLPERYCPTILVATVAQISIRNIYVTFWLFVKWSASWAPQYGALVVMPLTWPAADVGAPSPA